LKKALIKKTVESPSK
jgi:hypothetical protein